jgi:hypothetical protein
VALCGKYLARLSRTAGKLESLLVLIYSLVGLHESEVIDEEVFAAALW